MAFRDLIPWTRSRDVATRRVEDPFFALHREMNRLFDDVFHSFDTAWSGADRWLERPWRDGWAWGGWPHVDLSETDGEFKVHVELPGVDEKDVSVELSNGVLLIKGERKAETEDTGRWSRERSYGRFERRIEFNDVDFDHVTATFKNGLLTVVLPKSAEARRNVRRIAINSDTRTIEHKKAA